MRFATNKGCRTVRPLSSTPHPYPARPAPLQQGTHMVIPWVRFFAGGRFDSAGPHFLLSSSFLLLFSSSAGAEFSSLMPLLILLFSTI
jgi:hypothetical protein